MRILNLGCAVLATAVAGCSWFDFDPGPKDEELAFTDDGGDSRPTSDAGMDGGPNGMRPPDRHLDSGTDASDGEIEQPDDADLPDVDVPPDLPDGTLPPLGAVLTWQPEPRRFAIVDDSRDIGDQNRVWLLAHGDDDAPNRLVSYRFDGDRGAWLDTGVTDITSEPEALTHWSSTQSFPRVFFTRGGELNMWRHEVATQPADAGSAEQLEVLPIESGYTLTGGSLGSAMIMDGGEEVMVVIALAEKAGVRGYYCMYELRPETSQSSCRCSERATLSDDTEIIAYSYESRVYAFARGTENELRVITRGESDGGLDITLEDEALDMPEGQLLGASFAMFQGATVLPLNLMVVMQSGIAWHAAINVQADFRIEPAPQWTELPGLPQGKKLSTGPAALGALEIDITEETSWRSAVVYGLGENGTLYEIEPAPQGSQKPWRDAWYPVPAADREQSVLAIGVVGRSMGALPPHGYSYTFAHSFNVIGGQRGRVLHETVVAFASSASRDHMRPEAGGITEVAPAGAEISVASGADLGIAATVLRSRKHPQIVLSATVDNASSWHHVPFTPPPFEGGEDTPVAAADPAVAYGNGSLHFVDREWRADGDCVTAAAEQEQRIVYRRGRDVRALAALDMNDPADLRTIAQGGHYSAPSLVVTESPSGATAHVLYSDRDTSVVHYWRRRPGSPEVSTMPIPRTIMPTGTLQLAAGLGSTIHAFGLEQRFMRICDITNLLSNSEEELPRGWVELGALIVEDHVIHFGEAQVHKQGACPTAGGNHYKCFRDDKPYAAAASPTLPNKFYIAYAGDEAGASSIFLTMSAGTEYAKNWSTVLVHERLPGDTRDFFDAEVTVDDQESIVITYSAIERASSNTIVEVYAAHGYWVARGLDVTLEFRNTLIGTWDAAELPYDCATQRWALGDYRDTDTLGGRSLHAHRTGEAAVVPDHVTRWFNNTVAIEP